jgi:drug/metabolite transporter (DMT)-like permease
MTSTAPSNARTGDSLPLPELALIGIAAVWGLTFTMVQDAVGEIAVMTFLAFRFIPASLIVALIFRKELQAMSPAGWKAGCVMGGFLTAGYIFQTVGLKYTSASNAGFITGMFVVLTPLFGMIFLKQRAGWYAWLAAAISAFGLYLLSGVGGVRSGDVLVVGCACSFAFHILATDRAVRKHHIGALLAVQLGVAGLVPLGIASVAGDLSVPRGMTVWSALLVTSLIASALGFFVQTYAQQHAPPARTAVILASEPAFAGLFAFVLAGERFTAYDFGGALLILGAILFVELATYLSAARPLPES